MKRLAQLVATAVLTLPLIASAQSLTEPQARAAIAPWYALFNQPVHGDMRTFQEHVLTADYESCWGYLPGECWGRETSIKVVGGFAKSIPDMKFDIKEVLVAGDRASSSAARSRERRSASSLVFLTRERAFGSWPSISRRSKTARSLGRITSKTGSARSDSCERSSTKE
jgi:hypothetical protein